MMKVNTNIQKLNAGSNKTLKTSFGFKDGLQMFYSIKVNGEDKGRHESDSFVQYFPLSIYDWLNGSTPYGYGSSNGYFFHCTVDDVYENAGSVFVNLSRIPSTGYLRDNRFYYVFLDIRSLPHLSGIYKRASGDFTTGSYGSNHQGQIILAGKSLEGLTFDPAQHSRVTTMPQTTFSNGSSFYKPRIFVGSDSTPVHMDDLMLINRITDGSDTGQLVHGSHTQDPIHIEQEWTRCRMKRTFTNQTTADIVVREIGINGGYSSIDDRPVRTFFVRDATGDILIPPQGNIEVVYDIESVTQNPNYDTNVDGTNKALLSPFVSALYRSFENATLYANLFRGLGGSGVLIGGSRGYYDYNKDNSRSSENTGIILGTNNQYVSQTNTSLFNKITHGDSDGQLFHFGHYMMPLEKDLINQARVIRFGRLFKNSGSTSITIEELGVVLSRLQNEYYLTARAAYDATDKVTVDPGEYIQVEVTLNFPV